MAKNSNINNMRLEEIENITKKIRAIPIDLKSDQNSLSTFLEIMINYGSQLDYLFSSWDTTNPIWEIHEDLLFAYEKFKLRCVHSLIKSKFGIQNKIKSKYPSLTEDDGVTDLSLPLIHPDLTDGRVLLNNKIIRVGVIYGEEDVTRPTPEGIKQFKLAHESLKKKIEALSLILRNEINIKEIKSEKSKLKFKHKLPAGTMWESFLFVFVDSENVQIIIGNKNEILNFKELGLDSKKNGKPTLPWIFFHILAQNNGELKPNSKDKNDSYKKAKQALIATLENFFSIDFDPFFPYHTSPEKVGNSYRTKFKICCENQVNNKETEDVEKSFFDQCIESI
ncbi:MAG: hypothetical protein WDK96_00110 [Candidatus Paceibacterota bacterium]|jgi:hypothetical protein